MSCGEGLWGKKMSKNQKQTGKGVAGECWSHGRGCSVSPGLSEKVTLSRVLREGRERARQACEKDLQAMGRARAEGWRRELVEELRRGWCVGWSRVGRVEVGEVSRQWGTRGSQRSLPSLKFCFVPELKLISVPGISKYGHSRSKQTIGIFHFGFINKLY